MAQQFQKGGFPWLPTSVPAPEYYNSFKYNILDFLRQYGQLVPLQLEPCSTRVWLVPLRHKTVSGPVKLHVYEEHIDEDSGAPPTCDQCRNMGRWGWGMGVRAWHGFAAIQSPLRQFLLTSSSLAKPPPLNLTKYAGWQHHPVSNRRYHFILPSPAVLADPDQLPAVVEAAAAGWAGGPGREG